MSNKYLNVFLTVSYPSSRRTPSEEEWYWSTFSFHCMIICTVPIEVLFVVSVSCQIGQGGTFPWWGRAAFEMLSCSPLPSKLHVSVPSPYSHLGLPAFWNWQFQSYLRGIFRLISPLTETSWEYSLPLKVRAFKVTSNFRIISLNLEPKLVISNWTLELSILTAFPRQLKQNKRRGAFAAITCRTQTAYGPKSNGCRMKREYNIYVCACICICVSKIQFPFSVTWQWKLSITFEAFCKD